MEKSLGDIFEKHLKGFEGFESAANVLIHKMRGNLINYF